MPNKSLHDTFNNYVTSQKVDFLDSVFMNGKIIIYMHIYITWSRVKIKIYINDIN